MARLTTSRGYTLEPSISAAEEHLGSDHAVAVVQEGAGENLLLQRMRPGFGKHDKDVIG